LTNMTTCALVFLQKAWAKSCHHIKDKILARLYLNADMPYNCNICQQNLNTIISFLCYLKSEHQCTNMIIVEPILYYSFICSPYT
jgi:hypothetical protein